ncbi:MAG: succinate dehydrogenase flavoprotein subunit [Candidatus Bathyarchaeota archaeon BA1]|nr:MAG: succinate dehydrogenase flavoprotein subunit [Candidatus Bathyarchaeota archaeon BA1]
MAIDNVFRIKYEGSGKLSYETIDTDVLVIGAGGAGCRAAIEASDHNLHVTLLSKELFGKAHDAA